MGKIDNLKKIINNNKETIKKLIISDNNKYNQNISTDMIEYYINNVDYDTKKSNIKSYIIMYNGNPLITLYLAIKSILNNKNMIFMISEDYFYDTNKFIIDLFNKIIKANDLKNIIKIYFNCDEEKILENSDICDKIIYIDDKYNLVSLRKKSKVLVEYNGYNTVYVYYEDSDENYELLNEINEYCLSNNIVMQTLEDKDVIENIRLMNNAAPNYMCIILSNDIEKQNKFKDRLKSENIIINQNPFKDNKYIFKCEI